MKTMPFVLLMFCSFSISLLAFAQKTDSATIELQRSKIKKELSQLRDSIGQSISAFHSDQKEQSSMAMMRSNKDRDELTECQSRLTADLTEITKTAQNSWNEKSIARVQLNLANVRRQYHRICPRMKLSSSKSE